MSGSGGSNRGTDTGEFHRADPVYRRQMLVFLVVTAIVGLLAVLGLHLWLGKLAAKAASGDLVTYQAWLYRLLAALCIVFGTTAAGFAVWLRRIALDSRKERRWPPSNLRTSADVRIRYLTSADAFVTQLLAVAVALAALSLALFGWAVWLLVFA